MPAAITQLPLRPSRPGISLAGNRETVLEAALLSYELSDSIEGMARAEIVFGNWGGADHPGFQHFGRDKIDFGKAIKVMQGDATLFEGRITAIAGTFPEGGAPTVTVMAEDRLQDLRMTRRTRCFTNASLGDAVRSIAGEHGLQADAAFSGPTVPVLAQLNQTNLAFLFDLARRFDADVHARGDTLHVVATRDADSVALGWSGTLRSFEVVADLATQRSALVASGWDVSAKEAISHRSDKGALSGEIGQDEAGGDILSAKLGDRVDTLAHGVPRSADEARCLAEASYRHLARSFVTGEGVCETDPRLRPGARIEISGVGPLFEGKYRAIAVTHLFDLEDGARSRFRCNRPGLGRP